MSNTTNPPAAPQRAMTPEKGPLRWIVAAVVAAVLVLGFAAFLVVKPTAKRGRRSAPRSTRCSPTTSPSSNGSPPFATASLRPATSLRCGRGNGVREMTIREW